MVLKKSLQVTDFLLLGVSFIGILIIVLVVYLLTGQKEDEIILNIQEEQAPLENHEYLKQTLKRKEFKKLQRKKNNEIIIKQHVEEKERRLLECSDNEDVDDENLTNEARSNIAHLNFTASSYSKHFPDIIDCVSEKKAVSLDFMVSKFGLLSSEICREILNEFVKEGKLLGYFQNDDEGNPYFIYLSEDDQQNIANKINQNGRFHLCDIFQQTKFKAINNNNNNNNNNEDDDKKESVNPGQMK